MKRTQLLKYVTLEMHRYSHFIVNGLLFLFFVIYSLTLSGSVTIIYLIGVIALTLFNLGSPIVLKGRSSTVLRLILMPIIILLSMVNFAHFKYFETFITPESGMGRLPNVSEWSLLLTYWQTIPPILYLIGALYIIFLYISELNIHMQTTKRLGFLKYISIVLLLCFFVLPFHFQRDSWYSTYNYYRDLGPIIYIGNEVYASFYSKFFDKKLSIKENLFITSKNEKSNNLTTALNSLSQQTENISSITMPKFTTPPNIIFYQLESVGAWVLDLEQTPMPFLKSLMEREVTVEEFYGNDCHTIGSEFTTTCSILTSSSEVVANHLDPINLSCLPQKLAVSHSYDTSVYHANVPSFWNRDVLMPQMGYNNLFFSPTFPVRSYDGAVINTIIQNNITKKDPTLDYFIGYTSHGPHTKNFIERELKENDIEIRPFSGLLPEFIHSIDASEEDIRNYFGFLKIVDKSIEQLFQDLQERGELDNTIIVIFGDHRYYNFLGSEHEQYKRFNELPFVMHVPNMTPTHIPITASHMDIAPTLLHLLNETNSIPHEFSGKSIFSSTPRNYAYGKCGEEIYFFNSNYIIQGNQKTNLYKALLNPKINDKSKIIIDKIKYLTDISQKYWEYSQDKLFPDTTLIKSHSDKVYIIDNGYKRHIYNEKILNEHGYTSKDVHLISNEVLDNYPTGDVVKFFESHLVNRPLLLRATNSILTPGSAIINNKLVAHALGAADKTTGCNCREAFVQSYANGYRLFEVDLALTKDNEIVAFHEDKESFIGSSKNISELTHDEFKSLSYNGHLDLIDLNDLFALMETHVDTYLILDPKNDYEAIMSKLIKKGVTEYPDVLSRIIPQIYFHEQLDQLNEYPFNDIIYTLYLNEPSEDDVLTFLENQTSVTSVTMRERRFNEDFSSRLKENGVSVFVHTVNDKDEIKKFLENDIGVYTDAL